MNYSTEYWGKNPTFHREDAPRKYSEIISLVNYTPKSIIDIGCGAGFLTNMIYESLKPLKMVGVDISEEAINVATKFSNKNIKFVVGDFGRFEVKEKYDLGIVADLIEHIEDDKDFLVKAMSLCDKLIIRIPLERNCYNDLLKYIGLSDEYSSLEKRYGHIHHYNLKDLTKLFESQKIKVEQIKIYPLGKRTKLINNFAAFFSRIVGIFSMSVSANLFGGFSVFRLSKINE